MKRCVIIGGAAISDHEYIRSRLRGDDFNIFCDSGLYHMEALGIEPHLIIGDFDSHERPSLPVRTIVLPCEKDDTDTVYAVKEALKLGFKEFLFIGVIGGRIDHSIGNLSLLLYLDGLGMSAVAIDDYSEMEILSKKPAFVDDSFAFFSLLNISGSARGINIRNAKYTLTDAEISCEYQYGISNEPIQGLTAELSLGEGRLLLVKLRRG